MAELQGYGGIRTTTTSFFQNPYYIDTFSVGAIEPVLSSWDLSGHLSKAAKPKLIKVKEKVKSNFLDLGGRPVREVREIVSSTKVQTVTALSLSKCKLEDEDIVVLLVSPYLSNLSWLDLSYNCITDFGVNYLAKFDKLRDSETTLNYVNLLGNPLEDPIESYEVNKKKHVIPFSVLPTNRGREIEVVHGFVSWIHSPNNAVGLKYPPAPIEEAVEKT